MIRETPVRGYVGCCHAMSRTIQEKIAGAELVILPVARHLANMEAVEGFNEALLGFLARH